MKKIFLLLLCSCSIFAKDFTTEITDREKECFEYLFSALANKDLLWLTGRSITLSKMGNEIRRVPPLSFLSFMVKDPTLFENMTKVEKAGKRLLWGRFIRDFNKTCNHRDMYGAIVAQIDEFAEDVGVPVEELRPFVDNRDWSNLIRHLLQRKKV